MRWQIAVPGAALHEVIQLFEREGLWILLGPERTRELVLKFLSIGERLDADEGDILDYDYARYRICAYCRGAADEYRDGLCPACYLRWGEPAREPSAERT